MKSYNEIKTNIWGIEHLSGNTCSAFVKLQDCGTCSVVWGLHENGWEHVSIVPRKNVMPSWDDMCELKDIFFNDEEEVYQIHPPKSEYVNLHDRCLHLWKPENGRKLNELVNI